MVCRLSATRAKALLAQRSGRPCQCRTSHNHSALRGPALRIRTQALPDKPESSVQREESVPLEGTVQLRATQPVVLPLFMFANLAVYGIGIAIALLVDGETSNKFFFAFANMNDEVASGEFYRIITATFMHAGLLHLASNSLALWYIGLEAEAVYGYYYFAAIYLLSGISGNVASFMLDDLVTVGASGAIFGLLGAIAAYFFRNPNLEQSRMQLVFLFGLVTFNIALGTIEGSLVDNTGHIAGFVSGLWLGWHTCPQWEVIPSAGDSVSPQLQPSDVILRTKDPEDPSGPSETGSLPEAEASELSHSTSAGKSVSGETPRSADSSAVAQNTSTASSTAASTVSASTKQEAQSVTDACPSEAQKSISFLDSLVPDPAAAVAKEAGKKALEASGMEASERGSVMERANGDASLQGAGGNGDAGPMKEVQIRDVSQGYVALSVLVSFAVSMGALTWAGVVARSFEKGL